MKKSKGKKLLIIIGVLVGLVLIAIAYNKISDAKKYNEVLVWPVSELSQMLPELEKENGKIATDSEDSLNICVYKVEKNEFQSYVNACKEKGFTVDFSGYSTSFMADNKDGYSLYIHYDEKTKEMNIDLDAPYDYDYDEDEEETTEETTKKKETTKANNGNVDPDFKKTMDDYEEFFDEYIEFMKEYKKNPTSTKLISKYADYMTKYSEMLSDMQALEDKEMSTADAAYYAEVSSRITQKLAKASL